MTMSVTKRRNVKTKLLQAMPMQKYFPCKQIYMMHSNERRTTVVQVNMI